MRNRLELQRMKDTRIEQLANEKERLDYERAFALKRQAAPSGSAAEPEAAAWAAGAAAANAQIANGAEPEGTELV